jgi:parvulin-like peptidyl-prolyl isomerase
MLLAACSDQSSTAAQNKAAVSEDAKIATDVIARVGDQVITFSEINTLLNSAAVVGLSIPALGTPERDTVRIALLDKFVDANLIYLDALKQGADQDPEYRSDMQRFTSSMLAETYVDHLLGDTSVSDEEIETYFKNHIVPGTEFTPEARAQIESVLRKQKIMSRRIEMRDKLREGADITIFQQNFDPEGDQGRADDIQVAEVNGELMTWGETRAMLTAAGTGALARDVTAMEIDGRMSALQREIDLRLMAEKARIEGLDKDPVYQARVNEYQRTRLINLHRERLAEGMEPNDEELETFFEANRHLITVPEFRKVQMVALNTEDEAKDIKRRIETGEMTMYEAASRHSISPTAKQDLGDIGWVEKGKVLPGLQEVVFALGPGEIGGPVQVDKAWHIMRVLDVREAQREKLEEERTRKAAWRRYVHAKMDEYTVNLRDKEFKVEVYEDKIVQLAQQEADMVAELTEKARQSGSVTQERLKELQELLKP